MNKIFAASYFIGVPTIFGLLMAGQPGWATVPMVVLLPVMFLDERRLTREMREEQLADTCDTWQDAHAEVVRLLPVSIRGDFA